MQELTKKQIETALKDINSVSQNSYNIYCFYPNANVPDSIKVIKQILSERINDYE